MKSGADFDTDGGNGSEEKWADLREEVELDMKGRQVNEWGRRKTEGENDS